MKATKSGSERRPKDQKRIPLSMRITPQVRERLVAAAEAHGRSITQEGELRIEASFEREGLLGEALKLAYGAESAAAILTLVAAVIGAGHWGTFNTATVRGGPLHLAAQMHLAAQNWLTDPHAVAEAAKAAAIVFEALAPPGDSAMPPDMPPEMAEAGKGAAEITLAAVCDPSCFETAPWRNRELERQVAEIHRLAPDLVARIKSRRAS